ncbi:MAG TPA: ABC transporter permease [Gemmatimonadaceae bacterium]
MSLNRLVTVIALRLRSLFRRDTVEAELDEEMQYPIEQQIAENVRAGMSPRGARDAALRAFGGVSYQKERVRDTRGTMHFDEIRGDVAFAARGLRRAPGFAIAVIITLALGIGANTAMFTLLRGTLLRPLPNREGDRLLYLRQSTGSKANNTNFSVPEVVDYRAGMRSISDLAEYSSAVPFMIVKGNDAPSRARVGVVTGNFFDVMGLAPVLGRTMSRQDDGPSAASVTVLSYAYWLEHFGGDSTIVGKTVRLNDRTSTVVGVLQQSPSYPRPTDAYVNMVTSPHHLGATMITDRSHRMSELFARLTPTASVDAARREVARISATMFKEHPDAYEKGAHYAVTVTRLRDELNDKARIFWLLMGAAAFVLLIACANVANLTLMRGVGREREMLVRAALGAGTARLRRLLLVENLLLAGIGGILGMFIAVGGLRILVSFAAQFTPRAAEISVDGTVLAVGLLTSIIAALALSFVPRVSSHQGLAASLAPSGRRITLGVARQRAQRTLVVLQITVTMILLTGAGLLGRTLLKLADVPSGVRVDHVITLDVPLMGDMSVQVRNRTENAEKYRRIRDRVAALPGVRIAAIGLNAPLSPAMMDFDVQVEGRALHSGETPPAGAMRAIDANYFQATGIPILSGRGFGAGDTFGAPSVVILSQSLARRLFGDENAIGRRIAWTGALLRLSPFGGDWMNVVGIVGDTRDHGLDADPSASVYRPYDQQAILGGTLVVRTETDPAAMQSAITRAIHDVYPRQLVEHVKTLEQARDETVASRRLNAVFIGAFGALALGIAMVGVAGMLAFSVSSRTAEIGIRMSLGANAAQVRRMVLGEGGSLLVGGVVLGIAGALIAARLLQGMLFGVSSHDPVTLATVAGTLVGVGVLACWIPASRASRVDPAVALRAE